MLWRHWTGKGSRFAFLWEKFLQISMEKLKAGIFDGPQIREIIKDPMFDKALNEAELCTWQSLKSVVTNFLENHRSTEYKKEIEELLLSWGMNVSQTALSTVTLGLFSKELWRFEWWAEWVLSPRYSRYGRALARLVGCKLSRWLMLVLQMEYSGCQAQKEAPEKTFHPWIASFVYFSVYNVSFLLTYQP